MQSRAHIYVDIAIHFISFPNLDLGSFLRIDLISIKPGVVRYLVCIQGCSANQWGSFPVSFERKIRQDTKRRRPSMHSMDRCKRINRKSQVSKNPKSLRESIGDKDDTLARQRSRLGKSTTVSLARVPPVITTSRVESERKTERGRMNEGDRAGCLKGPLIPVSPSLVGEKRETVPGTLRARKHGQGLLFVLPSKQDWLSFYQRTLQSCSLA